MLAAALLFIWFLSGALLYAPATNLSVVEWLAAALPTGMLAGTLCIAAFAVWLQLGALSIVSGTVTFLALSCAVGRKTWRGRLRNARRPTWRAVAAATAACTPVVWLHLRMIEWDALGEWVSWSSPSTDLPVHAGFVAVMSEAAPFPPTHPYCAGAPFSYHALVDACSAVLMQAGASLRGAILTPDTISSICFFVLLWHLARRCGLGPYGAALTTVLAACGGGMSGYIVLEHRFWDFPTAVYTAASPLDFAPQRDIFWTGLVRDFLLPTRSMGPCLCLSLTDMILLLCGGGWEATLAGVAFGLMPVVNVHVFVATALVLAIWLMATRSPASRGFASVAIPLAGGLSFYLWHRALPVPGSLLFRWGWLTCAKVGFIRFWFKNLGFFTLLAPLGWFGLTTSTRALVAGGAATFVLGNVFVLANDWDDEKMMLLGFILGCVAVASLLERLASVGRARVLRVSLSIVLTAMCILSGVCGLTFNLKNALVLFTPAQQRVAAFLREHTAPGSVVLCTDGDVGAMVALGRRPAYLGLPGILRAHGIDPTAREALRDAVFHGELATERLKASGIDYIVRGPIEFSPAAQPMLLRDGCVLCFSADPYEVYRVPHPAH